MTKQPYDTGALDLAIRKYVGRKIDERIEELLERIGKEGEDVWLRYKRECGIQELESLKEEINSELGEVENVRL